MFVILEYREHDSSTTPYGPYETETDARIEANVAAARIAKARTEVAGVRSGVQADADGDLLIFDLRYADSEPTDDEWHVLLQVVAMEPYSA